METRYLSILLIISYIVKQATLVAVSASISTPVLPTVETTVITSMPFFLKLKSISIESIESGWHKGISSEVFFAASIPDILEVLKIFSELDG